MSLSWPGALLARWEVRGAVKRVEMVYGHSGYKSEDRLWARGKNERNVETAPRRKGMYR